jgi:ABC-type transport system involved in multi-copper enzyme maturation permease subunit
MLRIRQFLALASLTAAESIRQPICLLLASACVALTALTPMLDLFNFGEEGKLARDSGLAFHFVFGMLAAAWAASSSLARELRAGTASAVLSKPVGRATFLLAKFAGIAAMLAAFSACAAAATLLSDRVSERFVVTARMATYATDWRTGWLLLAAPGVACAAAALLNYTVKRPFESTAFGLLLAAVFGVLLASGFWDRLGQRASFDLAVQWRILPASLLIALALVVLAAVALALSTRLAAVPTLTLTAGVFLAGLLSDHVLGRRAAASTAAAWLYRLVPDWQHFWMADALAGGGAIPARYVGAAALYALLYTGAALLMGLVSFRNAEVR